MSYQQQPMQGTLICDGCHTLLVNPSGTSYVRCVLCSTVTDMPPRGTETMAQLVCGGCRTLLMYMRGTTSVRCSCCHTVNLAMETPTPPRPMAHINCWGCGNMLWYADGDYSVTCDFCQLTATGLLKMTSIGTPYMRWPWPWPWQQQRRYSATPAKRRLQYPWRSATPSPPRSRYPRASLPPRVPAASEKSRSEGRDYDLSCGGC